MFDALVIDNTEFARQDGRLGGEIEIAAMARLGDALADTAGSLTYRLAGHLDRWGRPSLECVVSGTLTLICQRCLQALSWPVAVSSDLIIGLPDDAAAEFDEGPDSIDADSHMDVHALIEDELLLALPLAPRHAPGDCRLQASGAEPDSSLRSGLSGLVRQRNDNDTKE